jgi:hypothetical protein
MHRASPSERAEIPYRGVRTAPFGGGARIRVGHRLGTSQLVLAAGPPAQAYTLEAVGGTELRPTFESAPRPAELRVRLRPRRPAETHSTTN